MKPAPVVPPAASSDDDIAWEDVHKAQILGYQVHPGFLQALRKASGRQE